MGDPRVGRFRKHFPTQVNANIAACLNLREGLGATILICCAIDLLAKYGASGSRLRGNKDRYIEFLRRYFPSHYDAERFYKFVRCGLVHSFDMDRRYVILTSKEEWAQKLHMKTIPNMKRPVINPFVLRRDMKAAHRKLADDLDANKPFRRAFVATYRRAPIRPQHYTLRKVKAWIEKNGQPS